MFLTERGRERGGVIESDDFPSCVTRCGQLLSFAEKRRLHYFQQKRKLKLSQQQQPDYDEKKETNKRQSDGQNRKEELVIDYKIKQETEEEEEDGIAERKHPVEFTWQPSKEEWHDLMIRIETGQWRALRELKSSLDKVNDMCRHASGEHSFLVPVSNTDQRRPEPVRYVCKTYTQRRESGRNEDERRSSVGGERSNSNEGDVGTSPSVCAIASFLLFVALLISLILILVLTKQERDLQYKTE